MRVIRVAVFDSFKNFVARKKIKPVWVQVSSRLLEDGSLCHPRRRTRGKVGTGGVSWWISRWMTFCWLVSAILKPKRLLKRKPWIWVPKVVYTTRYHPQSLNMLTWNWWGFQMFPIGNLLFAGVKNLQVNLLWNFRLRYGCFQKIGDFPPKWMVKIMEIPIKHGMIWGDFTHYFRKHPDIAPETPEVCYDSQFHGPSLASPRLSALTIHIVS